MSDELPPGWVQFCIADLGGTVGGKTPSKGISRFWVPPEIPWASPKDMKVFLLEDTEDRIAKAATKEAGMNVLPEGTVLMVTRSGILAHTFPVAITGMPTTINQDIKAILPNNVVAPRYLAYSLRAFSREILHSCRKQGTTVASVETDLLERLALPLAPLQEQKRIAEKLDALLARVDACRERLDRVPGILKRFRQSVLAAATSGELTREWREENASVESGHELLTRIRRGRRERWEQAEVLRLRRSGAIAKGDHWKARYKEPEPARDERLGALPSDWCWATIGEIAPLQAGYAFSSTGFQTAGIRLLKGNNIRDGWINDEQVDHWPVEDAAAYDAYRLAAGDIVLAMDRPVYSSGTRRTKVAQLDSSWDGALLLQRVGRFHRLEVNPEYLYCLLSSDAFRQHLIDQQNGSQDGKDLPHVSASDVDSFCIPLPPLAEQAVVAEVARAAIERTEKLSRAAYHLATSTCSRMEKALLAKAFRGQLVPQSSRDEPASELLARIKDASEGPPSTYRAAKRPRRKAS